MLSFYMCPHSIFNNTYPSNQLGRFEKMVHLTVRGTREPMIFSRRQHDIRLMDSDGVYRSLSTDVRLKKICYVHEDNFK